MTLDRKSNRWLDKSGFLHVGNNVMTRAGVDKYFGYEIPGGDELGLAPNKIYHVFRPPEELKRAMTTLHGLPILDEHNQDMTADSPLPDLHVGAVGTSARWSDADNGIVNEAVFHVREAIKDILSKEREDLSCGYTYDAELAPHGAEWMGQPYDLVMKNIEFNHVALVPEGRVEGAKVADRKPMNIDAHVDWDAYRRQMENKVRGAKGAVETWTQEIRDIQGYISQGKRKSPRLERDLTNAKQKLELAKKQLVEAERLLRDAQTKGNDSKVNPTSPALPPGGRNPNQQQPSKKKTNSGQGEFEKKIQEIFKTKGMDMATLAKTDRRIAPYAGKKPLRPKAGKGGRMGLDSGQSRDVTLAERILGVEKGMYSQKDEQWAKDVLARAKKFGWKTGGPEGKRAFDADPIAEAEGSLMESIGAIVDAYREHSHQTPEGEATSEPIEDEIPTEDNAGPVSPTLDAEEEFVAQVRDALEGYGTQGEVNAVPGEIEAGDEDLPAMDAESDLSGYDESALQGWIQKIEGELRNRNPDGNGDEDLQVGDGENLDLTPDAENENIDQTEDAGMSHEQMNAQLKKMYARHDAAKASGNKQEEAKIMSQIRNMEGMIVRSGGVVDSEPDMSGVDAFPGSNKPSEASKNRDAAEAKAAWEKIQKEKQTKGKAMDAKMAVDAAVRQMKAATDAKNAAIALVEPLVGSVTKLMAMDSAEDILRHALETHGEQPPANIGLAGLHGMVNMLVGRETRAKMGADNRPPKRKGVEGQLAETIAKARARTMVVN